MIFEKTTLGEYATIQGGYAFKSQDFIDSGRNAVLKIKNIRHGYIDYESASYVSDVIASLTIKWTTETGDILISMTGSGPSAPESLVGRVARVWKGEPRALINQRVGRLQLRSIGEVDQDFLFYVLAQKETQNFLVANSTGSANQVNISSKIIESVECPKVDFRTGREIANFLNTLEERMRLLRETNATLESIAQSLFKSWFVDFDPVCAKMAGRSPDGMDDVTAALFPDELEGVAYEVKPKGWKYIRLEDICTFQKGCSYKGEGLSDESGGYMFNLGCFNAPRVFAFEKIKRYTGDYKERHKVSFGDLVIANTDVTQSRAILGRPLIIPSGKEPGFISHHVFKICIEENIEAIARPFLYFSFLQDSFRDRVVGYATGTTVLALPRDALEKHCIVWPTLELLKKFSDTCAPIFEAIHANETQAQSLATIYDTLLPRLISGELRLSEVENKIEAFAA